MSSIHRYDVTLGWVGRRAQIVTVPTTLGPEAARRRAFYAMAALSPARNLDDLIVVSVEQVRARPCGNCGHRDSHDVPCAAHDNEPECAACDCQQYDSGLCRWCSRAAHTGVCRS